MKLLFAIAAAAALACGGSLAEYKTVYVLPMSGGLDQFLAIRLTSGTILQVVTDPQKADVIFTDRIGEAFEQKLTELYKKKPVEDESKGNESQRSFGAPLAHGKGSIFLVDRHSHEVVWSMYVKPRGSTPDDLNHAATEIATHLEKARKPRP